MRVIRLLLLFLLFLPLPACAEEPGPALSPLAGHTGNYEATAAIRLGELRWGAVIAQRSPDWCDVAFSAPDSVAGMEFVFRPGRVTVLYAGLEVPFDPQSFPLTAVAGILKTALGMAMRQDAVAVEETGAGPLLSGTVGAGGFQLTLTPDGQRPLKLFLPTEELEITFLDFTFID